MLYCFIQTHRSSGRSLRRLNSWETSRAETTVGTLGQSCCVQPQARGVCITPGVLVVVLGASRSCFRQPGSWSSFNIQFVIFKEQVIQKWCLTINTHCHCRSNMLVPFIPVEMYFMHLGVEGYIAIVRVKRHAT